MRQDYIFSLFMSTCIQDYERCSICYQLHWKSKEYPINHSYQLCDLEQRQT